MTAHPYDQLEAFALGALDEQANRDVLAHADSCPTCAVLLGQAMRMVDTIEPKDTVAIASPGLRAADAPPRSMPFERAMRVWRAVAIAGATAACVALLWSVNAVRSARSAATVELALPISSLVHSHFLHHGLKGPTGSAKVIQALDGSWVYLVADGLPPNAHYTLMEMTGDEGSTIGEGSINASGQIAAYWKQTARHINRYTLNVTGPNPLVRGPTLRWP